MNDIYKNRKSEKHKLLSTLQNLPNAKRVLELLPGSLQQSFFVIFMPFQILSIPKLGPVILPWMTKEPHTSHFPVFLSCNECRYVSPASPRTSLLIATTHSCEKIQHQVCLVQNECFRSKCLALTLFTFLCAGSDGSASMTH